MLNPLNLISSLNLSATKRKTLTNILWAVTGKCISLLGVLIVGIIVARYLGREQYGLMNYVVSYVAIFQVFADFGLDLIQIREESRDMTQRDRIIGTVFGLKLICALLVLVAIVVTTFLFETDSRTRLFILIYAVSILLNTSWVSRNHFTAMVWNEYVVKTEISRTLIGIGIKVLLVLLHLPLIYFILSLVIDSLLLATGYTYSYIRKIASVRQWRFDRQLARYMVRESFPLLLSGAAIIIYNRIDQIMIDRMLDHSSLGLYSVAVRFIELMVFVPTIIAQTVSPILVGIYQNDRVRYQQIASVFMNITVWACLLLAVVTSLLAYPIVYFTFGQTYIGAAALLSILAFKVVGDALSQTSGQLIIIENVQKYASVRNLIGCVVCVVCNLFFIQRYGLTGVAYVALITIFCSGTMANLLVPPYRKFFAMQMRALVVGWRDATNIKTLFR